MKFEKQNTNERDEEKDEEEDVSHEDKSIWKSHLNNVPADMRTISYQSHHTDSSRSLPLFPKMKDKEESNDALPTKKEKEATSDNA